MSLVLPSQLLGSVKGTVTASAWKRALREPLLHFAVLGALVFLVDHVIATRENDPHVIRLEPDLDREIKTIFRDAQGRDPSAADMKILRERWIDNEVLYREGLALGVDRGDPTIRERVIFKALNVMQSNLTLPTIDEQGLRNWYAEHRANYEQPARLDFLEAVLIGDKSDEAVKKFVAALNAGIQSDAQSGLRVYKGRPRNTIVASFGAGFTEALEQSPIGAWRALPSKDGVHVVLIEGIKPGTSIAFEEVRAAVYQDWKDQKMQALRTLAVRDLGKKYTVKAVQAAQ